MTLTVNGIAFETPDKPHLLQSAIIAMAIRNGCFPGPPYGIGGDHRATLPNDCRKYDLYCTHTTKTKAGAEKTTKRHWPFESRVPTHTYRTFIALPTGPATAQ